MLLKPRFLEIKLWRLKYENESARGSNQSSDLAVYCDQCESELQECSTLAKAMQKLQPRPEEVTVENLLSEEMSLSQVLSQITTPNARRAVYAAAYGLAQIDGITPAEQQLLDQIQTIFQLQPEDLFPANFSVELLPTTTPPQSAAVTLNLVERIQAVRNLILDYAIGAAILGLLPLRGSLMFELQLLAATVLVFKMKGHIGSQWGYSKGQDVMAIAGSAFGCLGAFSMALMAWATVFCVGLFVPFVGSMALATSLFTWTWAIGQATSQFYVSGCQMDVTALTQSFQDSQKAGEAVYKVNLAVLAQLFERIAAKQKAVEPRCKGLAEDLKADKMA